MNHARSRSYDPCRDPLHDAGSFEEQYKRCAVLKDLQNSHDWKEQFMACQRQLVRARRWKLGKARRAHAATSRASTPGGKAKAKAKSTASRAGATARASTPGAPSPAASTGATARASSVQSSPSPDGDAWWLALFRELGWCGRDHHLEPEVSQQLCCVQPIHRHHRLAHRSSPKRTTTRPRAPDIGCMRTCCGTPRRAPVSKTVVAMDRLDAAKLL